MKKIIIIPARLGSTRLPDKPLADICGQPMIVRVLKQAEKTMIKTVVAAAEERIISVVEDFQGFAIKTEPALPSGTDRIYEAFKKVGDHDDFEIIVNVQGDLPIIDPDVIKKATDYLENSDFDIVTAVVEIKDEEEIKNPNVVKAVVSWDDDSKDLDKTGKALYFSRSTAPYGEGPLYHHVGIYAYKKAALEKFVSLSPSVLENREKLEQLRALENNITIGVVEVDSVPIGVDTKEDLEKVIKILEG